MLENPYAATQLQFLPAEDAFQGEGRIEESADGSRMTIWWESTLNDGIATQWRMQQLIGAEAIIRKQRRVFQVFGGLLLFLSAFTLVSKPPALPLGLVFLFASATFFLILPRLVRWNWGRAIRKVAIAIRGIAGNLEMTAKVEPMGLHLRWLQRTMIYDWPAVDQMEVSPSGLLFLCHPAGVVQIPLRVFPDAATLERCVSLAKKYRGVQPA